MKIKNILLILVLVFATNLCCVAKQIPTDVKNYLMSQKNAPIVRFDGVVTYKDGTMYLPVFPAYPENVDKIFIKSTYPAKQNSMDKMPEIVVFNNNFSLLKVINSKKGYMTVTHIEDIPVEVRTGILPQDLLVPKNFVIPESLKTILGDVKIPVVNNEYTEIATKPRKSAPLPNAKKVSIAKVNINPQVKDKLYFVNNFRTPYLRVFTSGVSEPLYSIETTGPIKDVKSVLNGTFLLAATSKKKNIDVIDIKNEYIAKHIDLTSLPSEILVDDNKKKAYVASVEDESLSVIDLNSMVMKEKIQLIGSPEKLALSPDGYYLAYSDRDSSNVYILSLNGDYENKLIYNMSNITKMLLNGNKLYIISRIAPKAILLTFDLSQDLGIAQTKKDINAAKELEEKAKHSVEGMEDFVSNLDGLNVQKQKNKDLMEKPQYYYTDVKEVEVGRKPVDMLLKDDTLFVLSASANELSLINTQTAEVTVSPLSVSGFSKAITKVPNTDMVLITNTAEKQYVVYDLKYKKAVQNIPINDYINMITIVERL